MLYTHTQIDKQAIIKTRFGLENSPLGQPLLREVIVVVVVDLLEKNMLNESLQCILIAMTIMRS